MNQIFKENKLSKQSDVKKPAKKPVKKFGGSKNKKYNNRAGAKKLADNIIKVLDKQSGENIVLIDLHGKSSVADFMIISSGRSNRHVSALADYVQGELKQLGIKKLGVEGDEQCDWVLVDAGDVIIHIFMPDIREIYALEKLWTMPKAKMES